MKLLQTFPQCTECLMGMTQQAVDLIAGNDPCIRERAESMAREILAYAKKGNLTTPEAANQILRAVSRLSGISDPFAEFKHNEMAGAKRILSLLDAFEKDDLRSLVSLAVLGNSLDFFKDVDQALAEIPDLVQRGVSFFHDDIEKLDVFLSADPRLILYLSDNAGEIYFDYPLYAYIRERTGRTILVVKGGPSLNDLTLSELQGSQLSERFTEAADTGTDGVGIEWDRVSDQFLTLIDEADLIISKGMANLESIYPRMLPCPVFFLFKAKCKPMQEYFRSPADSYWALWYNGAGLDVR
jgi:damage-control phosphatase, subfamily I